MILEYLINAVRSVSVPNESDSEYDGAFSYASEWHAFAAGCAVGFAAVFPSKRMEDFVFRVVGLDREDSKVMSEALQEGWYALGGVVIGALLAIGVLYALVWVTVMTAF